MARYIYNQQFELQDTIANGGFATVYRALDRISGSQVAIKIGKVVTNDPGYAKSIREEARILGQMNHASIVRLQPLSHMAGRASIESAKALELPGSPDFFVMEYLAGETLNDYLHQVPRLTHTEAAAIACVVARGLHYAHHRGYAHNDLKLENIVFRAPLQKGGTFDPVLIDFGIATQVKVQDEALTIYIAAPEQLAHSGMTSVPPEMYPEPDPKRVDVWGLGIMMYRMLAGEEPFTGRNQREITDRIMTSRPKPLTELASDVPRHLNDLIIEGCLAKNPQHRATLMELGRQLCQMSHNQVVTMPVGKWWKGLRR